MEQIKTVGLLTLMSVIMVSIGGMLGGQSGMLIALVIVGGMNFYSYFYSDKMVLKHYNAIEVDEHSAGGLYAIVRRLTQRAEIPMPKVYIIADHTPNAFATGRNPGHAAVAITEGLLDMLDEGEVEAVIAHELSHVRHYDILIGTVAATIAGAITMIANMMQFSAMFGGRGEGRPNPLIMIVLALILPVAAMVIQMSVSRSREYLADEGAARLTGHPEWLQSALAKLSSANHRTGMRDADEATAHMFIVNPLSAKHLNMAGLFRTHPTTEDRIERLEALKGDVDRSRGSLYERD